MDAYEQVNETDERYFEETYPARTTVGACELLGGAAVTVNAVVAVESLRTGCCGYTDGLGHL